MTRNRWGGAKKLSPGLDVFAEFQQDPGVSLSLADRLAEQRYRSGPLRGHLLFIKHRQSRQDLPLRFAGSLVSDLPGGDERHFAFVVPLDRASDLAEIRLVSGGRTITRRLSPALAAPSAPATLAASRVNTQEAEVRWDPRYPMALVRDAETGQILSFARATRSLS